MSRPRYPIPRLTAEQAALAEAHLDYAMWFTAGMGVAARRSNELDIDAAARLGLVEAAARFDPDRGIPFAAFAIRRIRGAVIDEARTWSHIGRRSSDIMRRIDRAGLSELHDIDAVAAAIDLTPAAVNAARVEYRNTAVVSLDAPRPDTDNGPDIHDPNDAARVPDFADALVDTLVVEDLLARLPHRQRCIIVGWFWHGIPYYVMAEQLGVTASRVSQLRAEALATMRDHLAAVAA